MGMDSGSAEGMATGVIAASANATLTPVASAVSSGALTLERVVAPDDGWIVVRSTTFPGAILGSAPVRAGETRGVRVELDNLDDVAVRVALHVDRGTRGTLEFDPLSPATPLDKPVFADGLPVERRVEVRVAPETLDPSP